MTKFPKASSDRVVSPASPSLLSALLSRRSVKPHQLTHPGPDDNDLATIVAAGVRGADHGGLRPWRLILITDRQKLADAFEAAHLEHAVNPPAAEIARARERATSGPVILALIAHPLPDAAEIPVHEQWIAVGAAIQQMLLAADALGFAGSILSGHKVRTNALRSALAIDKSERLVGFLTIGSDTRPRSSPKGPVQPGRLTSWPS
jgi:nitroreductase